jgi:Zinc finger, C3HC4 type (RING finger)
MKYSIQPISNYVFPANLVSSAPTSGLMGKAYNRACAEYVWMHAGYEVRCAASGNIAKTRMLYAVMPMIFVDKIDKKYILQCNKDFCIVPNVFCIELKPNAIGAKYIFNSAIYSADGELLVDRYNQINCPFETVEPDYPFIMPQRMIYDKRVISWRDFPDINPAEARSEWWDGRLYIYDSNSIYEFADRRVVFAGNGQIIWQFIEGYVILADATAKNASGQPCGKISQIIRMKVKKPSAKLPECPICFEHGERVAYSPCGHATVCTKCDGGLRECPICRAAIKSRIVLRQ